MSEKYLESTDEQIVRVSGPPTKKELRNSRTDWDRVDNMTEEELEEAIKNDPDTLTLDDVDMSTLRVVNPRDRKAISLRMETDVWNWYRENYSPYQTQINAVLKAFKEAQEAAQK